MSRQVAAGEQLAAIESVAAEAGYTVKGKVLSLAKPVSTGLV